MRRKKMAEEIAQPTVHPSRAKLALHRKLLFGYGIVGAIVGYVSFLINVPLYSLVLAIVVGIAVTFALKRMLKPQAVGGKRWWSSGALAYAFIWLIVWTILFNMYIVTP